MSGVRSAARAWLTLLPFLLVQGVLLGSNIGLLAVWTDEAFTLDTVARPVQEILEIVRRDIHPPLYFLLAHGWLAVFPGLDPAVALRMFSAFWTLAATIVLDRCWLASLEARPRYTALALWCSSPAVLLYGRMGRSYLMQAALALAAVALTWSFLKRPGAGRMLASALAIVALLYTHYIPGMAVGVAFGTALALGARRRQVPYALAVGWAAILLAEYLPWLFQFREAFARWGRAAAFSSHYSLTGSAWGEHALKLAYGAASFSIGENFPAWALAAGPVAVCLFLAAIRNEWHQSRELIVALAAAGALGYIGVARWVSYPFIPARMLWLLPFFLMGVALALNRLSAQVALMAGSLLLMVNVVSLENYYSRGYFLNKSYSVPLEEIAAQINSGAGPARTLVLVDGYNTDLAVLRGLDPSMERVIVTSESESAATAKLREARFKQVWFVTNTHDISPGGVTSRVRAAACAAGSVRRQGYAPFAAWELRLAGLGGMHLRSQYFYEVDECRR